MSRRFFWLIFAIISYIYLLIIGSIGLLVLPILFDLYYLPLYFITVIVLIPMMIFRILKDKMFEERFYQRWHKARKKGFLVNVVLKGLRSFFTMIIAVSYRNYLDMVVHQWILC